MKRRTPIYVSRPVVSNLFGVQSRFQKNRMHTTGVLSLLLASTYVCVSLNTDETCDLCRQVLKQVHGHFSADVPSRRKLTHQLKHECNRHFNYRRRCLLVIKDKCDLLFKEMRDPDFNSTSICFTLQECTNQQPPVEVPPIVPIDLSSDTENTTPVPE